MFGLMEKGDKFPKHIFHEEKTCRSFNRKHYSSRLEVVSIRVISFQQHTYRSRLRYCFEEYTRIDLKTGRTVTKFRRMGV